MQELPEDIEGMILDAMQSLPGPDDGYPAAGLSDQKKAWIAMMDLAGAIQMGMKALYVGEPGELVAKQRLETYRDGEGLLTGEELKRLIRARRGGPSGNGAGVKP